tara:strand:+ start:1053 stop:1625 length:573 start_codon:yes stop_codon:yes gene_type:complete
MQSPFSFIVRPVSGKRYNNIKNISGVDIITNVSLENHKSSNRYAEVISLPINYKGEIKPNDILLVHHNVFKFYYDMQGVEKSGRSFFRDDLFFIDNDQFFLYYDHKEWRSHSKYCFVKPVPVKKSYLSKTGKEEPLIGLMKYINKDLEMLGVKVGDEISFTPDSEYEFEVDGEKLYRMFTNNITMVLNDE